MLFVDGIGHLRRVTKEVEVSSYITLAATTFSATAKRIIVQVVASLLQLIAQTIVGVFEIDTENPQSALDPRLLTFCLHLFLLVLESLQFSRLCDLVEWILVLKYALAR
jgi:hypothetical protein